MIRGRNSGGIDSWINAIAFDSEGYIRKYKKFLRTIRNAKGAF